MAPNNWTSNTPAPYSLKSEERLRTRDALRDEGITGFYRIGDCVAPRLVADCVFDGHRLAREIDSDNPEVPLPFKRERNVIEREAVPA